MQFRFVLVPASILVGLITSVGLVACSAAPNIPQDLVTGEDRVEGAKDAGKKKKDAASSNEPNDPGPATPSDAGPAGTNACGAETKQEACYVCCETANPKALPFLNNEFGKCACETPGACKAECATTFCAGKEPAQGDACDLCLTKNGPACVTQADTACEASADCKGLFQCDDDSKCETKAK